MGVSFLIRPTSALPWAVWALSAGLWKALRVVPGGIAALAVGVLLDRGFFGLWVFSPLNFVRFNSVAASHYGAHAWHWYASNGLPTLALSYVPLLAVLVLPTSGKAPKWPQLAFAGLPAVFSWIPHKEFRFLLPTWGMCLLYSGPWLHRAAKSRFRNLLWVLFAFQLLLLGYFGAWHQSGPLAATKALRAGILQPNDRLCHLTPCHAIPGFIEMHQPVVIMSLECDPPLDGMSSERHTPSDAFFENVEIKIDETLASWNCSILVAFEPLFEPLLKRNFSIVWQGFHAHFPSDSRHGHRIAIFRPLEITKLISVTD